MSLNFLFNNKAGQNRKALFYKLEIENEKVGNNNFLDPDGIKKKFAKIPIEFTCGVYESKKTFRENVMDGLNTTSSSLILFTNDLRVMNLIDRGDKVRYENQDYAVMETTVIKNYTNSQYQRYAQERYKIIVLG